MSAELEFEGLSKQVHSSHGGAPGKLFGKKCIKINGKAGIALFQNCLVFKLPDGIHKRALSLTGSVLWDPSGKGKPFKEWVQITMEHRSTFGEFARSAADYVG